MRNTRGQTVFEEDADDISEGICDVMDPHAGSSRSEILGNSNSCGPERLEQQQRQRTASAQHQQADLSPLFAMGLQVLAQGLVNAQQGNSNNNNIKNNNNNNNARGGLPPRWDVERDAFRYVLITQKSQYLFSSSHLFITIFCGVCSAPYKSRMLTTRLREKNIWLITSPKKENKTVEGFLISFQNFPVQNFLYLLVIYSHALNQSPTKKDNNRRARATYIYTR